MHKKRHVRAVAVGAAAVLSFAACGGDDDDGGGSAESVAFCDAAHDVETGFAAMESGGSPEAVSIALDAAEANRPDDIADDVATLVEFGREQLAAGSEEGAPEEDETTATTADASSEDETEAPAEEEEGGPPDIPPPAFFEASANLGEWVADNCGFESIEVTATNYKFEGFSDEFDTGTAVIRFTNEGTEFHELFLFRIDESEQRSMEELVQLPEEETEALPTEDVGSAFAPPDAGASTIVDLEPGRYGVVCFIPVGATPDVIESGEEPDGAPHFTEGMFAEFEVNA